MVCGGVFILFLDEAAENMKWALNAVDVLGAYREYDSVEAVNEYMISLNPVARYFPGIRSSAYS